MHVIPPECEVRRMKCAQVDAVVHRHVLSIKLRNELNAPFHLPVSES